MKEKFRLRCDLNSITDIADMEGVTNKIEQYKHIQPYHRYSYLFRWYHDLTHGNIDDETFFTLGDIYSEKPLFNNKDHAGLESIFMIEESIDDDTLYIVEESAWEYYIWKKWWDEEFNLWKEMIVHWSEIIVV